MTATSQSTIRIPQARQGQTGMGQGGWTAYEFATAIGEPVTIALKSPIPLDVDLDVTRVEADRWHLTHDENPDVVILEATSWVPEYPTTSPVTIEAAAEARRMFPMAPEDHPAPHCASCGLQQQSLRAHAGPLGDGRWATPFHAPAWSLTIDGKVDEGLLWMAMDCSCGWYTSMDGGGHRRGVTVQFAVDVYTEIRPETDYALVAWSGDHAPNWEGRKRGAASALFDANGACVAQSRSFWIAVQ